jgi:hypothetical protein
MAGGATAQTLALIAGAFGRARSARDVGYSPENEITRRKS